MVRVGTVAVGVLMVVGSLWARNNEKFISKMIKDMRSSERVLRQRPWTTDAYRHRLRGSMLMVTAFGMLLIVIGLAALLSWTGA